MYIFITILCLSFVLMIEIGKFINLLILLNFIAIKDNLNSNIDQFIYQYMN